MRIYTPEELNIIKTRKKENLKFDPSSYVPDNVKMKEELEIIDDDGKVCIIRPYWIIRKFDEIEYKCKHIDSRLENIETTLNNIILFMVNKKVSRTINSSKERVSKKLRREILTRDNFTCKNCGYNGLEFDGICHFNKLHIDHIIPREKGGKAVPENLQTLCSSCNLLKKNYLFEEKKQTNPDKNRPIPQSISKENK